MFLALPGIYESHQKGREILVGTGIQLDPQRHLERAQEDND